MRGGGDEHCRGLVSGAVPLVPVDEGAGRLRLVLRPSVALKESHLSVVVNRMVPEGQGELRRVAICSGW